MQHLISVIVPIYNVEKYLKKCIDSIINQTYNNLEIILVDDGSPDNCGKICDEYALIDNRIKVLHKENGGLSDARNAGMKIATGEYVSFIDSDDYILSDFIETLYNISVNQNSDIVECDVYRFKEDNEIKVQDVSVKVENYETEQALVMLIQENEFRQHVWNKLYRSSIALKVPFEKGKINEDEFWTYQIFGQAKKVSKINKEMYFYLQRESSIMGEGFNLRRLDVLEAKVNRQKYIEENFPEISTVSKTDLYGSIMFAYQSVLKFMNGTDKKTAKKAINKFHKKNKLSFNEIDTVKGSSKKYLYLAKFNFYLCCKFRAVFNIGF